MDVKIARALISVSDKTGIVEFAKKLSGLGIEIISTGGTAKLLRDNYITVKEVSKVTGFPEIMDGRVKTLHPNIYGGILAVRDDNYHIREVHNHNILLIDLVVVNLYPFEKTIADPDVNLDVAIENIDIGGPSMLRAASKNFKYVTVVVNPERYKEILDELESNECHICYEKRSRLAVEAFTHTSAYDAAISSYLRKKFSKDPGLFPDVLIMKYKKLQDLRYGENPHQKAAFYSEFDINVPCIAKAEQIHGKELSYNNIMDADAAINLVMEFEEPTCAVIKHANPCGVSSAPSIEKAYKNAYDADPLSAFGGIIAVNKTLTAEIAKSISLFFAEIVIAPEYKKEALDILKQKKNIRLLKISDLGKSGFHKQLKEKMDLRKVVGGLLYQDLDAYSVKASELKTVTVKKPTKIQIEDMLFAWKVTKYVKSNAIVIVKNKTTLGIGAGQTSRVGSAKIALESAKKSGTESIMASDGLFPKPDSIHLAGKSGVSAIIQPGGSIQDEEVIKEADKLKIAMVFTGVRHFKH